MLLFATTTSPRLQHVAAWLGQYLLGRPLPVCTNVAALSSSDEIFNYSELVLPFGFFQLKPHPLLFEKAIQEQPITIIQTDGLPCFFATAGGDFPFDILAAAFYLLQRYEEYLPHPKDLYGRYAHTGSLAFRQNFLHLPLVDLWMQQLKQILQHRFPNLVFAQRRFSYRPTYDVDIACSYRGKGWLRNAGGLLRSAASGKMNELLQQAQVLMTGKNDPFDTWEELNQLHRQYGLQPVYFFLLAQQQKGVDKNISPAKMVYRQLVQATAAQYRTGIHLSAAASASPPVMDNECRILEAITGQSVNANRMHYLLFQLPETYRQLQQLPLYITQEFSMGYGSINGFRASTCTPYFWYDLEKEISTGLQILPFCYMEANSIFEQKDSPEAALAEMKHYLQYIRQVEGCYITIFHNHLIGRTPQGRRWMNMYQQFLTFLFS